MYRGYVANAREVAGFVSAVSLYTVGYRLAASFLNSEFIGLNQLKNCTYNPVYPELTDDTYRCRRNALPSHENQLRHQVLKTLPKISNSPAHGE